MQARQQAEAVTIATDSAQSIGASLWTAAKPVAVVLIHPGTAIGQRYYEPFARYLTDLGFHAVTYDYRGTGRSRPASLRGVDVTMADWIEHDAAAVTRWAAARFPDLPLFAVGHSLGGHAVALSAATASLRGAVLVASHAGATAGVTGAAERARIWCVMRVLTPVLCAVFGYMPLKKLGLGDDLPAGVMRQWSRWTALPRYFFDDPAMDAAARMGRVAIPLLVLGFDDDPWANRRAVDVLIAPLVQASVERRHIKPAQAGLKAIGHMGFFRNRSAAPLWPQVGLWLHQQMATAGVDGKAACPSQQPGDNGGHAG
ncbi:MAG: alpha/beta fold hydrolase [Duganella sp.]